jgi:hypothetical protein
VLVWPSPSETFFELVKAAFLRKKGSGTVAHWSKALWLFSVEHCVGSDNLMSNGARIFFNMLHLFRGGLPPAVFVLFNRRAVARL